jgi:hypothetical protein
MARFGASIIRKIAKPRLSSRNEICFTGMVYQIRYRTASLLQFFAEKGLIQTLHFNRSA